LRASSRNGATTLNCHKVVIAGQRSFNAAFSLHSLDEINVTNRACTRKTVQISAVHEGVKSGQQSKQFGFRNTHIAMARYRPIDVQVEIVRSKTPAEVKFSALI
jgi:hypothetical protein